MPHKPPINPVRWTPPPVDALPDFPSADLTIVPMPGDAPEDVVVGADGTLWTGLVDGRIVRVSADDRGLLSLDPGTGALEVLVPDIDGRPLRFCSNVTETEDGTIYFTESTSSFHYEHFRAAILEARGDGGLYKLATDGTVSTLRDGLYFANGVTVTADGTALVFAETQGRCLSKYWLSGPQAGTITPLAINLPGMPDNISTGADGRIWVAFVTPINAAAEWLAPRPTILRQLVWRLPDALQPQMALEVWAVAFDPDSGAAVAGVRMRHRQFGQVTGLVEHDGRLWMSSIGVPALAHCAIPERR
ncbi:SMP-30/gluconolactonase/LRE family protein [Mycolicibacterium mucogenicum]|uniref:SMP-30/gluconolactonase/LRE family protein n=1 Tax=Mycolicibacterium mucogenicum TaxID=56689 RepID=UPI00076AD6C4|nr:SMP-30/gluconolactonase/LRE family protein [Mycolicibacterium mucogenicum]